ncbi:hypothetical protein ATERTT37_004820 [Aspergillus terreus]
MKLHFLPFLATLAYAGPHSCRCRPHQRCWPSPQEWNALNRSIDGNLVPVRPVAAVCHPAEADSDACKIVTEQWTNSTWRASQPGAVQWENFEAWPEHNESCYIENPPNVSCGQGRISLYSARVQSAAHIQKAVRFAKQRNIRLAVKNSGHCFLGRSAAVESLQILTHDMKGIELVDDFLPAGAPADAREGPAVTIDAGVSLREMYTAVGAANRTVVGGSSFTVGAAGGYVQGGGHSLLGPLKGMASDNALEFTIVTAEGDLITANQYQNGDLFWALRGGGGGTFGVVVNVTLRTFDEVPVMLTSFNITTAHGNPSFWEALTQFHAAIPGLNDANGSGYYWITPNVPLGGNVSAAALTAGLTFANETDPARIDELFRPLLDKLNSLPGIKTDYASLPLPSVRTVFDRFYLLGDHDSTGTIGLLGSRLFSRDLLASADGAGRLIAALQRLEYQPGRALIGHMVAGGAVAANGATVESALHPAWRRTAVHLVLSATWEATATLEEQESVREKVTHVEVPLLRSVEGADAMGSYLNEANAYETEFQASFWGSNYPRLYRIKQRWDPTGVFIVQRGVGSEDWDEEGICRKR